jgi:hypothetical protein
MLLAIENRSRESFGSGGSPKNLAVEIKVTENAIETTCSPCFSAESGD